MTRTLAQSTTEQATWAVLLVAVSAISSSVFACVTPFPALAVAAAYVLPARAAAVTAAAVWLANQAVGFGYLHYPWDQDTILWGIAIGVAAVVATMLASIVLRQTRHGLIVAAGAALVVAFGSYELALFPDRAGSWWGGRVRRDDRRQIRAPEFRLDGRPYRLCRRSALRRYCRICSRAAPTHGLSGRSAERYDAVLNTE
jgi:hypothetical protein